MRFLGAQGQRPPLEERGAQAGVPIAGGHTIDLTEPIYGLVAIGTMRPDAVRVTIGLPEENRRFIDALKKSVIPLRVE